MVPSTLPHHSAAPQRHPLHTRLVRHPQDQARTLPHLAPRLLQPRHRNHLALHRLPHGRLRRRAPQRPHGRASPPHVLRPPASPPRLPASPTPPRPPPRAHRPSTLPFPAHE